MFCNPCGKEICAKLERNCRWVGEWKFLPEGRTMSLDCTWSSCTTPVLLAHDPCAPCTAPSSCVSSSSRAEFRDVELIRSAGNLCCCCSSLIMGGIEDPARRLVAWRCVCRESSGSNSSGMSIRQSVKTSKNMVTGRHTLCCDRCWWSHENLSSIFSFLLLLLWVLFPAFAAGCCQLVPVTPPCWNHPCSTSFLEFSFKALDTRCIRKEATKQLGPRTFLLFLLLLLVTARSSPASSCSKAETGAKDQW